MVDDGDRLRLSHRLSNHGAISVQADKLQFAATLAQPPEVRKRTIWIRKLVSCDSRALATLQHIHGALDGEVFLHVPVGVSAQVRVPKDGIRACHESADAVLSEVDARQRRCRWQGLGSCCGPPGFQNDRCGCCDQLTKELAASGHGAEMRFDLPAARFGGVHIGIAVVTTQEATPGYVRLAMRRGLRSGRGRSSRKEYAENPA